MKKILIGFFTISMLTTAETEAAYLRFINNTGCDFYFYGVQGFYPTNPPVTFFAADPAGPTIIPANTTPPPVPLNYANPTLIPGYSSPYLGTAYTTGRYDVLKMVGPTAGGVPQEFPINDSYPGYTYTATPACYGTGTPVVTRFVNPITGDWTIFIN